MRLKTKRLAVLGLVVAVCLYCFSWIPSLSLKSTSSDNRNSNTFREVMLSMSGYLRKKNKKLITNFDYSESVYKPVWSIHGEIPPASKSFSSDNDLPVFSDHVLGQTRSVTLVDTNLDFFTSSGCLEEGTQNRIGVRCQCKNGWHGKFCSIPDFVDENQFRNSSRPVRSSRPRRLIYGITFNIEFEMLELRLGEAGDLIDAIIIVESNYTGYGEPKKLYLLEKLKRGFLKEHQRKIVYLFMGFFPTGRNRKDGAYTDFYTKNFVGNGLRYIKGGRDDDIFIMSDADEIHRRQALLFLKVNRNYPEPVGGYFRRNVFGFFWSSGVTKLGFACSLRMLRTVYGNKSSELRGATSSEHLFSKALEGYDKQWHNAQMWQMGEANSVSKIAGWHCSWCLSPDRIRTKLRSAYNYDFPRWGDYPEKTKLDYIRDLVKVGLWFDDKSTYKPQYVTQHAPYAPHYAFKNVAKFSHLLFNPYLDL